MLKHLHLKTRTSIRRDFLPTIARSRRPHSHITRKRYHLLFVSEQNNEAKTIMVYGKPRKVQIIPSVLPADFGDLGAAVKRMEDAGCDRIQFDVMDGNFVPNVTFGPDTIRWSRKYTNLPFETQLMVSEKCTDAMLDEFVEVSKGPNGEPGVVIVHVEAQTHLHRTLAKIRALGGSPSVALNPHTPAEIIENVLDLVDHVLVMTVNPGFGGQKFIPTMVPKIEKIRKWIVDRDLDVDIEVDGGIKATKETIRVCAAAGANCFIAGSGLFAYDDMAQGVKELTALAREHQEA
jgi:ribulose-phosphate 3-epimerase